MPESVFGWMPEVVESMQNLCLKRGFLPGDSGMIAALTAFHAN